MEYKEVRSRMAAPAKPAAPVAGGYQVSRPQGQCLLCAKPIVPNDKFMAALTEIPEGFSRTDCCLECWEKYDKKDVLAFWRMTMPVAEQKKKVFVDDAILCELLERLADVQEPAKISFRFVLALILMRKRLVFHDSSRKDGDKEIWVIKLRGKTELLDLINPHLDETQILDVSRQLSEILNQEM